MCGEGVLGSPFFSLLQGRGQGDGFPLALYIFIAL